MQPQIDWLPHLRPAFGEAEGAAAQRVLGSAFVGRGPETARFEEEICEYFGLDAGHCVAVGSGTAALQLALSVLKWQEKRVAVPLYTCASLQHAVRLTGGSPVPIDTVSDVHADMDIDALNASGAQRAIAAHMFGIPQALGAIAVPFIEDVAQAFGATVDGKPVGLQGIAGICSFGATKMITSGGCGGALISRDRPLVDEARDLIAYVRASDRPRVNFEIGDLQSAIGRVQLQRLPELVERREELFARYTRAGVPLMDARDARGSPVRLRAVVVSDAVLDIQKALAAQHIRSRVPINEEELGSTPTTSNAFVLSKRLLFIPIFPEMKNEECDLVAQIVMRELEKSGAS